MYQGIGLRFEGVQGAKGEHCIQRLPDCSGRAGIGV